MSPVEHPTPGTTRRRGARRRAGLGALVVATLLATAGCGSGDEGGAAATDGDEQTFVGRVDGTDAYVAVVTDGDEVLAYLCDSEKLWNYLDGSQDDDRITAGDDTAAVLLDATLDGDTISGTVTLPTDGSSHAFTAVAATGEAGLFTLEQESAESVGQGGWIRLADGSVRGKQVTVSVTGDDAGTVEPDGGDGGGGGSGVEVPPDAEPASVLGLAACGIAGARLAIAMNRANRNPTQENRDAANAANKIMNGRCGAGAAT